MGSNNEELSIPELAHQIENHKIDPKIFDKVVLRKCAIFFKRRRYLNEDIAEILGVCGRTVDRYLQKIKAENSLNLGINFQQELLGETLNNLKLRYQRLLRLSYSDNLSDYEKARTILLCHQVEMNGIAFLIQLGYLSREKGLEDMNLIKEKAEEEYEELCEVCKKQLEALSIAQDDAVREFWSRLRREALEQAQEMIARFIAENEKRKRGRSQLICSVTVFCN